MVFFAAHIEEVVSFFFPSPFLFTFSPSFPSLSENKANIFVPFLSLNFLVIFVVRIEKTGISLFLHFYQNSFKLPINCFVKIENSPSPEKEQLLLAAMPKLVKAQGDEEFQNIGPGIQHEGIKRKGKIKRKN